MMKKQKPSEANRNNYYLWSLRFNELVLLIFVLFVLNVMFLSFFSGALDMEKPVDLKQKYNGILFPRRSSVSSSDKPPNSPAPISQKDNGDGPAPFFNRETSCKREFTCNDCDAYFCYEQEKAIWTERNKIGDAVKFEMKELWWKPKFKEAALFDVERKVVLVILRTKVLIKWLEKTDDDLGEEEEEAKEAKTLLLAKDSALETEEVLYENGNWKDDAKFKNKIPPKLRFPNNPTEKSTIMVLVSAYKDQLCAGTLKELFEHATFPDRVTVGVVLQSDDLDGSAGENCLEKYCKRVGEAKCRRKQVTQLQRPLKKSRGVMPARYLQQTLIKDEEFCLQIDSHMVFPPKWDEIAISDWLGAKNEMAVMTTYPNRVTDRDNQMYSPARCDTEWGSNVVAGGTSARNIPHKGDPILVAFFGAGIAFSKCHANLVVPYDGYMSFLFKGEEYNRSARLWTHGYDLYAPRKNYAYHYYDDDPKPKEEVQKPRDRSFFGGFHSGELLLQSEYRWQAVFGMLDPPPPVDDSDKERMKKLAKAQSKKVKLKARMKKDLHLFGLGDRRSLKEYELFSGINLLKHTNQDLCPKLGKMEWIPWTQPSAFNPLGMQCVSDLGTCCLHTLNQTLVNAFPLNLNLDNVEWANAVFEEKNTTIVVPSAAGEEVVEVEIGEPIISPGWYLSKSVC